MADVFVGFVYDEEKEQDLLRVSKVGVSTASNQYQKGFLSGLDKQLHILTALSTGAFPKGNKRLFFKRERRETSMGQILYLPFLNFYLVRDAMFYNGFYRELSQIVCRQKHTTVYVYSLYVPSLKAMKKLKKRYGEKVHYCLIIPDLPGKYGIMRSRYSLKGIKDRLDVKKKLSLPEHADSYVFLTEEMKNLFPQKPYGVIEGFLPSCGFDYTQKRIPKTVLYTGSLNAAFGIKTLLEAFSRIPDEEYRLWICGAGDGEAEVRRAAQRDKRIEFMGFLPKSEISRLQTRCDVLINPRPAQGEFTKYSFPSKTMEYLLSGSKVVMYRLPGVPDEYYDYIRTIEAPTVEAVQTAICHACKDTDFYDLRWQEQVRWIEENKNAGAQVKKITQLTNWME